MFNYICNQTNLKMKKITFLMLLVMLSTTIFSQKKEKIKGSKIVTIEKLELKDFNNLEIEDDLEVFLIKGDKNSIEIEADDNLHTSINHEVNGTNLRLNTNKEISGAKKVEIRLTYTDALNLITIRQEAKVNIITEMALKNITIKTFDYSKTFMNVNSPNFTLLANDKSKVELNLKSEDAFIEMSKNGAIKALIASNKLKIDMYQKSSAVIEGDVNEMKLRLDNNAEYTGKNLNTKQLDLIADGSTNCSLQSSKNVTITATGKTEISIYGEPKIELKKFTGEVTLYKKSKI
jgi:Putative auto-transporter adhesin, head GIN domain